MFLEILGIYRDGLPYNPGQITPMETYFFMKWHINKYVCFVFKHGSGVGVLIFLLGSFPFLASDHYGQIIG